MQFSCHVTVLMTPGYDVVMHSFSASLRTGLRPFPKQRARSQANFRLMKDKRLSWNVPVYNFFSLMFTKREMNFSASTTLMLVISSMKLIISVQVSIQLYLNIYYQSQKEAKTKMFQSQKQKKNWKITCLPYLWRITIGNSILKTRTTDNVNFVRVH